MSIQQWVEGDTAPWTKVNENNDSLGQAFFGSENPDAHTGLTVGINGGNFDEGAVADDTLACTDDDTNYIVCHRASPAFTVAITTTNWDNTATYGRVARAVFAGGVLTWHDERWSVGGIFRSGASAVAAEDVGVTDTGGYYTGTDVEAALQEVPAIAAAAAAGKAAVSQVFDWSVFIGAPSDKSYTLVLKASFAGTITETTTKSASGTCTATFKINSTALGGTANSVSSSEQSQAHASSNAFSAGDDIVLTVSSNSSCADMSATIKYSRTLA